MVSARLRARSLALYYLLSAFSWLALLIRFGVLLPLVGQKFLPGGIADYFLGLQTVSLAADLATYIAGAAKLNIGAFLLNAAVKLFVSFVIIFDNPKVARTDYFSTLILSWGLEELIKYVYLSYRLKYQSRFRVPGWLKALYLGNFVVLFPVRCISEMCLSFMALKYIDNPREKVAIRVVIVAYLPVSYIMFKKMWSRRQVKGSMSYEHMKKE